MVLGKTYKPFPSSQFLKFQENGASASMQEGGHDFLCLHSEMQNCPPVCDYKDLRSRSSVETVEPSAGESTMSFLSVPFDSHASCLEFHLN